MSAPAPGPAPAPCSPPGGQAETSGGQFLALILRFFVGYGVLFACLLLLLRRPAWTLSAVDVVFWLALVMIVVLHRLSVRTASDIAQWRSAALRHVVGAGLLWVAGQSVHVIV